MAEIVAIEFESEIRQIKTMSDRSFNIVLNVPEYGAEQVKKIMDWLQDNVKVLMVNENDDG